MHFDDDRGSEKRWKQTEEYGRKEQRAKHKVEI